MTLYGTLTLGGFDFLEAWTVPQSGNGLTMAGQQTAPPSTADYVKAAHHNVTQAGGLVFPVLFSDKPHLNGFYRAGEASSELYERNGVVRAVWSLGLERIGSSPDVEIESRVPTISRSTDHAVTPVYWHAPAVGYSSYMTGTANPSAFVTRTSADGDVIAHLGIPTAYAPRWTINAAEYLDGASRLLLDSQRRLGAFTPPHTSWQVDNGLVRLTGGASGAFNVACWDSGVWASERSWQVTVSGSAVATTPELTVLRNDPEEVVVRLTYPTTPTGRVTVDLGLRRGSRFVTGIVKRNTSATLGVKATTAVAGTSETGRVRASANDPDGNRYVVGSAKTFTADTTNGGVSKASVTVLDFFVGHAVGGSGAVAGDTPADLIAQYGGTTGGERAAVVWQ